MRSLFVVLLLANVALFAADRGWFGQPPSERGRDPGRLKTEIRADSIQVPRLPGINAAAEPGPSSASTPSSRPSSASGAGASVRPAVHDASGPAATANAAAAGSPAASTAAPAQEAAMEDAPPHAQPDASSRPATETPAPPASAVQPLACVEWGAFNDAELGTASKWSAERLPAARRSTRREPGKQGWMVILPPLGSAAAAQSAAAQLGRDGVKDFFIIQDGGPLHHAISLGVFSTENAARKHAATLQGQGVRNAKVVPRETQGGKHWLRLEGVSPAGRRALEEARGAFSRASVRDCR